MLAVLSLGVCVLFCTNWQEFNFELCTQVPRIGLEAKRCSGMCKARGWDVDPRLLGTPDLPSQNLPQDPLGVGRGGQARLAMGTADIFTDVLLILDY